MSHYKKLSIINRVQKRGQNEPPPDPSRLTFDNATPQRRQTDEGASKSPGGGERSPLFLSPEIDKVHWAGGLESDAFRSDEHRNTEVLGRPFEHRKKRDVEMGTGTFEGSLQTVVYPDRHISAGFLHPDRENYLLGASHSLPLLLGPDEGVRPGIDEGNTNKNDVIGMLSMGEPLEDIAPVMYRGLFQNARTSLIRLQSTPKSLKVAVDSLCKPDVYRDNFIPTNQEFIGSGYIQGFAPSTSKGKPGSFWAVERLYATLMELGCGGWFHAFPHLSMIVYPNDSPKWQFLSDQIRPVPTNARLRFVLQPAITIDVIQRVNTATELHSPSPPPVNNPAHLALPHLVIPTPPILPPTDTTQASNMATRNRTDLNTIMLERFGINYQMIVSHTKDKDVVGGETFFVVYPPSLDAELQIILRFLEYNGANKITIYRDGRNGRNFCQRNPEWSAFTGVLRDKYSATLIVGISLCKSTPSL